MKKHFWMRPLLAIIIALLNLSCITVRNYQPVSLVEVLKMPPFKATVETIEIDHPFIFMDQVQLWLRKADGGHRLYLQFAPANKFDMDFAHTLHEGQSYIFPQVIVDFYNSQTTNKVRL
jgi:hypothetical protein